MGKTATGYTSATGDTLNGFSVQIFVSTFYLRKNINVDIYRVIIDLRFACYYRTYS